MAQTKVNIKRLVDNISKTNVYTPLVEAIANSIDSIDELSRKDGEIVVTLIRDSQKTLVTDSGDLRPVVSVKIRDNGVGFNLKNLEAFNTIYTEEKIRKGGKGFGRFVYLKYFDNVHIESVFNDRGIYHRTSFNFVKDNTIIQDESKEQVKVEDTTTTVNLDNLKREHVAKLDKKIETIARKLLEKLLVYFLIDNYACPKIILEEEGGSKQIVLNDYFGQDKEIVPIGEKKFTLESPDKSAREEFTAKVFKIFYGESRSSVNLVADHRQVTEESLQTYVPEFSDGFYDIVKNPKGEDIEKSYTIKTYVLGRYLDNHVSLERDGFEFEYQKDLFYPFSRSEIEKSATNIVKEIFPTEIKTRQDKKKKDIKQYVDEKAPWHKTYFSELDLSNIPYGIKDVDLESELQKIKYNKETIARVEIDKILKKDDAVEVAQKTDEIIKNITEIGKSELVHYIALRKTILELFKKSLTWSDDKKFEKEKVIHDIIFPTSSDSDELAYDRHNLWILDEKLSFTQYLASDKPLNKKDGRPDILLFDNVTSFRSGNDLSNPITIFEFKRPQRTGYGSDENPLKQIADYVKKIRSGNFKTPEGRDIYVNENTPAYGFLVCDLSTDIRAFCDDYGLTKSPDNKGYFGFHANHKIYYEVISFDKIVSDSELRNKIFFRKLGIE